MSSVYTQMSRPCGFNSFWGNCNYGTIVPMDFQTCMYVGLILSTTHLRFLFNVQYVLLYRPHWKHRWTFTFTFQSLKPFAINFLSPVKYFVLFQTAISSIPSIICHDLMLLCHIPYINITFLTMHWLYTFILAMSCYVKVYLKRLKQINKQ